MTTKGGPDNTKTPDIDNSINNNESNEISTKGGPNNKKTPGMENRIIENQINIVNEKNSDSFKYISEDGTYLNIFLNSSNNKLNFKLNLSEDKQYLYSNDYTYEELILICPLFTIEDDIEGINQLVIESINNYGINLSNDEYDENKKLLIIKIDINSKIKEVRIILKKIDLSEDELISSLIDKVNNLLNERKEIYGVKSFTQVKNELSKTKEKLSIKLDELDKKLDKIGNTFNALKETILLANSNIIYDSEEVKLILDAIKKSQKIDEDKLKNANANVKKTSKNDKSIKKKTQNQVNGNLIFKLIYRASRDGDSAKEFHKRCDNIGTNLILVKTDKNVKFGGFTNYGWEIPKEAETEGNSENGVEKEDYKSFCFSLTSLKIYFHDPKKKGAIFCCENYGPTFSDNIFAINNNMLSNGGYCGKIENSCFEGQSKDYEISGEEERFNITELEVFEIVDI